MRLVKSGSPRLAVSVATGISDANPAVLVVGDGVESLAASKDVAAAISRRITHADVARFSADAGAAAAAPEPRTAGPR